VETGRIAGADTALALRHGDLLHRVYLGGHAPAPEKEPAP
jgi:hypothetical protein